MKLPRGSKASASVHPIVLAALVILSLLWWTFGIVLFGKFVSVHGRLPWGEIEIITYFLGGSP